MNTSSSLAERLLEMANSNREALEPDELTALCQAATALRPVLPPEMEELKKLAEGAAYSIAVRMLELRMGSGLRAYFTIDEGHHTPFQFEIETDASPTSKTGERFKAVCAFIAAANPQTVLKLIASISTARADTLFDAIKHGDAEHQSWLEGAISAHFAGQPVPPAIGPGNKDKRIVELEAALSTARADGARAMREACARAVATQLEVDPDQDPYAQGFNAARSEALFEIRNVDVT